MKIKSQFRLLASLIILVLTVSLCVCAYAEDQAELAAPKTSVSTPEYAFLDAMDLLSDAMHIYVEDNMTRADFSYVISRLAGFKGDAYKASKTFMDVASDAYYCDGVNYLYDMDIVRGSGYRIFEPDAGISYNEMAKLAVRVLGYEEIAMAKYGDSPLCYIRMANYLDLFEGVDMANGTDLVPTVQAVTFLRNTALAPTAQVEVYGGESSEFVFDRKNTLLYINYGIAYNEGVVYDNGLTSITGPSALKAGAAKIGDTTLRKTKGLFDVTGYIGMYVDFYYDEDEEMLIYAELSEDGNVLTLTYDQLDSDNSSFSHTNVVYYNENDKVKSAKISMNASMIYNGVAYPGYSLEQLKIKSGYMTLIDNGNDKVYDIVTVIEYDDRYLTSFDTKANMIYTEGGTIRLDDYKNVVITDHTGKISDISKLTTRNVVSVVASKDNTSIRIIDCSFAAVKGTVTEADEDYYYINDKPYKTSYAFLKNQEAKLSDSQNPEIGTAYTFLLNADGDIVKAREESATGWYTGYCVGIANEGKGMSADVRARIFMLDKSLFEPYLKEKIKLTGTTGMVKAEELLTSDKFFSNGKPIRQPVRFKLNNWGEITEIETPADNIGASEYGFNTDVFSKDLYFDSVYFKGDSVKAINGMYFVSKDTLIIYDPYLDEKDPGYEIKDIEVLAFNDMTNYSGFSDAYIYDIDASLNAGIMVFGDFGSDARGDEYWDQKLLTVDKVSRVLDEEGIAQKCITGIAYGTVVKYNEEKEGIIPAGLKQGDVCRIKTVNGELSDIELLISLDGEYQEPFITGDLHDTTWSNAYGPIYSVSGNSVVLVGPEDSSYGKLLGFSNNNSNTKITIYDRELKKVYAGTWNDVYTNVTPNNVGDAVVDDATPRAYIYRRYDYAREMVIVK